MNPGLIKQNLGFTAGLYQTTVASATDPTMVNIVTPKQTVNFVNVGMTVAW